jgi:hypothetical protein
MNSASQQRQQVRRDFTGQSIETPPVRAGKARTAKRKRNMDKHRKDNKAQESRQCKKKKKENKNKKPKTQNKTRTRTKTKTNTNRAQDQDKHQKS